MTTDQAKFILQSFRPDGSDSNDPSFTEALSLAAENRELGEWLARERATDAAFASILAEASIPGGLRQEILDMLNGENTEIIVDSIDGEFIGALAQMAPPANLKSSILAAMEAQEKPLSVVEKDEVTADSTPDKIISIRHWFGAASAAAAVIIAALLAFGSGPVDGPLSRDMANAANITYLNASFQPEELDFKATSTKDILSYLKENKDIAPDKIPTTLMAAKAIGCKVLEISGKKASLICYETEDYGLLHLVTFKSEDVLEAELCPLKDASGNCISCPTGQYSIASWFEEDKASFLYSAQVTPAQLSQVF